MKHLFVPYAIALALKEKGFDERCFAHAYTEREDDFHLNSTPINNTGFDLLVMGIAMPIHQQAVDWLLEKHNLDIHAHKMWHYSYNYEEKRMETFYQVSVSDFTIDREERDSHGDRLYLKYISSTLLKTYKEAIEDGITWALKHIK